MGLKYTVGTVGELKKAIAGIPDDIPFQILCDSADYRLMEIQSCYDTEPERFVGIEPAIKCASDEHAYMDKKWPRLVCYSRTVSRRSARPQRPVGVLALVRASW